MASTASPEISTRKSNVNSLPFSVASYVLSSCFPLSFHLFFPFYSSSLPPFFLSSSSHFILPFSFFLSFKKSFMLYFPFLLFFPPLLFYFVSLSPLFVLPVFLFYHLSFHKCSLIPIVYLILQWVHIMKEDESWIFLTVLPAYWERQKSELIDTVCYGQ